MQSQIELVEISLSGPNTPITPSTTEKRFEQATDAILSYVLGDTVRERDEYDPSVEESLQRRNQTSTAWAPKAKDDGKPHVRFFAVGPSTYQIRCPLCKQRADSETVQMSGILGHLSCLLSTLSCCFPIFSLSFVYLCLQSRLKSKRMFCNRCGGHLGFYWRPT
uniref:LITAF domain-containing protein n=1 Tax=Bactrocera dorsalis TaxID=27457 RepID=A0A034WNN6_BACDO